jgi:uncharacterized protein YndB with AHSA1/START domain
MTIDKKHRTPRALADVDAGKILASVDIAVTAERVFSALTNPEEVVRWWGSDELYRTKTWTSELKVGGSWRADGVSADGTPFGVTGEYLEIDPPRKLVQTWKPDWDRGLVTTLTYLLEPIADGTRLTVRHEGFLGRAESCRGHAEGWTKVLAWLTAHVEPPAAPPRYFCCRLIGPRSTFPGDATAEELGVMREHLVYWTKHLEAGRAIVFGPVMDPNGAWGLGVVRVLDEAGLRELIADDPVIRSGIGFRYDALPMARAVFRD